VDLWTRCDVERSLTALARACARYEDVTFRNGYEAALSDVAAAFGLVGLTGYMCMLATYCLQAWEKNHFWTFA